MGRLAPRVAGLGGTLSLALGVASVARAQEPAPEQPVRVQYDAPQGCPDEVAFFLHVRARTQRIRAASEGELAASVTVHITNEPTGSAGMLEMPGADGKPFARRVEAATCGEVELALSLVLALAYDPDAITTFPESTAPAPPPPPTPPPPVPAPTPPPEAPPTPPVELAFGVTVLARSGIAPSIAPLFGAFVEYGAKPVTGFSPTFQAALFFSPSEEATASGTDRRSASLQYFGGRLLGCPVSLTLGEDFSANPCLTFDAGRLFGVAGEEVDGGRAGGLMWLSIGAEARIRWKIVRPIFVEVAGGGGLTFLHEKFLLKGPPAELFAIPAAFGEVGGAVGIHFP